MSEAVDEFRSASVSWDRLRIQGTQTGSITYFQPPPTKEASEARHICHQRPLVQLQAVPPTELLLKEPPK